MLCMQCAYNIVYQSEITATVAFHFMILCVGFGVLLLLLLQFIVWAWVCMGVFVRFFFSTTYLQPSLDHVAE